MILRPGFYLSSDVVSVARQLLGKYVVTDIEGIVSEGMIVETEAYRAPDDKACHAYGNKYTDRTKTMFEEGGAAYIYTCYGIHPMLNVVTGAAGQAHAVLIRAVTLTGPSEHYLKRRGISQFSSVLANGPGKLTVAMGINRAMDGLKIYLEDSPLRIEDRSVLIKGSDIISTSRVGMSIHTGPCAHRPWRFYIKNNPWVSKPLFPDYRSLIPDMIDEIY
jgi:DNA-3-methyladenine glycosylase